MARSGSYIDNNLNAGPRPIFVDTQFSALDALQLYVNGHRRTDKPGYAKAVISGYAQSKVKKGKSLAEVDSKLHELQRVVIANKIGPFVTEFQEVREELHRPGSSSLSTSDPPSYNHGMSDLKKALHLEKDH